MTFAKFIGCHSKLCLFALFCIVLQCHGTELSNVIENGKEVKRELYEKFQDKAVDLVFVLDRSGSISRRGWISMLNFLDSLLDYFTISGSSTRVCVITFSTTPHVIVNDILLGKETKCSLLTKIRDRLTTALLYGFTATNAALEKAANILYDSRRFAKKVVFVLTDGHSNMGPPPVRASVKLRSVRWDSNWKVAKEGPQLEIYAFGIKDAYLPELRSIGSSLPNHTYYIPTFTEFERLARLIHSDQQRESWEATAAKKCDSSCSPLGQCACGTQSGRYACICEQGYEGDGYTCTSCQKGYYKNYRGSGKCFRCHSNSSTPATGTKDPAYCKCQPPYFKSSSGIGCNLFHCPKLPDIAHGHRFHVSGSVLDELSDTGIACRNTPGDSCHYTCDVSHRVIGNPALVCQLNGSWTGQVPGCQGSYPDMTILSRYDIVEILETRHENGPVMDNSGLYGCTFTTIRFKARHIHIIAGGNPGCPGKPAISEIDCRRLDYHDEEITNADVNYINGSTTYDSWVEIQCHPGWRTLGDVTRKCGGHGMWSGTRTRCVESRCSRLLSIKGGAVMPRECVLNANMPGTTCRLTCNDGYKRVGEETQRCNGKWTPRLQSSCRDNAPPVITCPGDIEVPVGENNSALIHWDEEKAVATDNSGNTTITIFGRPRQSPIRMGLGYHQLRYVARDYAGNVASCIRRIQVLGSTIRVHSCPENITINDVSGYSKLVSWPTPNFIDQNNNSVPYQCSRPSGSSFTIGTHNVRCYQKQKIGKALCQFSITLIRKKCELPSPPFRGAASCASNDLFLQVCTVHCNSGFDFALPPADVYKCNLNAAWSFRAHENTWPDCSESHRIGRAVMKGDFSIYYFRGKCEDVKEEIVKKFRENMKKTFSKHCSSSDCRVTEVRITCGQQSRKKREVNPSNIPIPKTDEIVPSKTMSFAKEHAASSGTIIGKPTTFKLLTIAAIYIQPLVGTEEGNTIEPTKTKHFPTVTENITMHTNDNEHFSSDIKTNPIDATISATRTNSYKDIQTSTSTVAHIQFNVTTSSRDDIDIREHSAGKVMPTSIEDDVASADLSLPTSDLNDTPQQSASSVSPAFEEDNITSHELWISTDVSSVSSFPSIDGLTVLSSSFPDSSHSVFARIFTRTFPSTNSLLRIDETTRGIGLKILSSTLKEAKPTAYGFEHTSIDDTQTSTNIMEPLPVQPSFTAHDENSSNMKPSIEFHKQPVELSVTGDNILSSQATSAYGTSYEKSDVGAPTLISPSSAIYDTNSEIVEIKRSQITVSFEIFAYLRRTSIYDQIKLMRNLEDVHDAFKNDVDNGKFNMSIDVYEMQLVAGELTLSEPAFDPTCLEGQISIIRRYSAICVNCPIGTYILGANATCVPCPLGTYQSVEGQHVCERCPEGSTTLYHRSTSPTACKEFCPAGFSSPSGLVPCEPCGVGEYQSRSASKSCSKCPVGTTTKQTMSSRRTDCKALCVPGKFNENTGTVPCRLCPDNTYQSESGGKECAQCPNNMTTTTIGSQALDDCIDYNFCQSQLSPLCLNGGICVNYYDRYKCLCRFGFSGIDCEENIDDCRVDSCLNNGTCQDGINAFTCDCVHGFTGHLCEVEVDACDSNPCQNTGSCVASVGSFSCYCLFGYTGTRCDVEIDHCLSYPCSHGVCNSTLYGYFCKCDGLFAGHNCDTPIHPCSSRPCQNKGACIESPGHFTCRCSARFTGIFCEDIMNYCLSNPCQNGGTCIQVDQGFVCKCVPGYGYNLCQQAIYPGFDLVFNEHSLSRYVKMRSLPDLSSITVGFWMRSSDKVNYGTVFSYTTEVDENSNMHTNVFTLYDYGKIQLLVNNDSKVTNLSLNNGCWHHVIVSWQSEGGNWCIYVNGSLADSGTNLGSGQYLVGGGGHLIIGQNYAHNGQFALWDAFIGEMSQFNIYDSFLNDTMIHIISGSEECSSHYGNVLSWPEVISGIHGNVSVRKESRCLDVNECLFPETIQCPANRQCVDVIGTYTCDTCFYGYDGPHCDQPINECELHKCQNNSTCTDGPLPHDYHCNCVHGFEGELCDEVIDACQTNPCVNNGTCVSKSSVYTCQCPGPDMGPNCEERSKCFPNPCLHSERCVLTSDGFECECPIGYIGEHCQKKVDFCFHQPCQRGGICEVTDLNFVCKCLPGWTGRLCNIAYELGCDQDPCLNNGACRTVTDSSIGYECDCGKESLRVDLNCAIQNPCDSHPCHNEALCTNLNNGSFECHCSGKYTGQTCNASFTEHQFTTTVLPVDKHDMESIQTTVTTTYKATIEVKRSYDDVVRDVKFEPLFKDQVEHIYEPLLKFSSDITVSEVMFRPNEENIFTKVTFKITIMRRMGTRDHEFPTDVAIRHQLAKEIESGNLGGIPIAPKSFRIELVDAVSGQKSSHIVFIGIAIVSALLLIMVIVICWRIGRSKTRTSNIPINNRNDILLNDITNLGYSPTFDGGFDIPHNDENIYAELNESPVPYAITWKCDMHDEEQSMRFPSIRSKTSNIDIAAALKAKWMSEDSAATFSKGSNSVSQIPSDAYLTPIQSKNEIENLKMVPKDNKPLLQIGMDNPGFDKEDYLIPISVSNTTDSACGPTLKTFRRDGYSNDTRKSDNVNVHEKHTYIEVLPEELNGRRRLPDPPTPIRKHLEHDTTTHM